MRNFSLRHIHLAITLIFVALATTLPSKIFAQYGTTDFIVAGCLSGNIMVYNSSLLPQTELANGINCPSGLDLLSNGNVVSSSHGNEVRFFNPSGMLLSSFTNSLVGTPIDTKHWMSAALFVGTNNAAPIASFTASGTFLNTIGSVEYDGIAVLPGSVLWAGGPLGLIDVYSLPSGTLTSTITLDNGQGVAEAMYYSPTTSTVLMTDLTTGTVFERTTTGAFVRQFVGGSSQFGVTRGPSGDVYATDCFSNQINHWTPTGTFLGSVIVSPEMNCPVNIIWAGNTVVSAANIPVTGRVFTPTGRGLSGAIVHYTDQSGATKTARTNPFGYFRFGEVQVGGTYVFGVINKRYQFSPKVITINENIAELNFSPQQSSSLK
jgi:Carboxypeptidase regulatory-like domain